MILESKKEKDVEECAGTVWKDYKAEGNAEDGQDKNKRNERRELAESKARNMIIGVVLEVK